MAPVTPGIFSDANITRTLDAASPSAGKRGRVSLDANAKGGEVTVAWRFAKDWDTAAWVGRDFAKGDTNWGVRLKGEW